LRPWEGRDCQEKLNAGIIDKGNLSRFSFEIQRSHTTDFHDQKRTNLNKRNSTLELLIRETIRVLALKFRETTQRIFMTKSGQI